LIYTKTFTKHVNKFDVESTAFKAQTIKSHLLPLILDVIFSVSNQFCVSLSPLSKICYISSVPNIQVYMYIVLFEGGISEGRGMLIKKIQCYTNRSEPKRENEYD